MANQRKKIVKDELRDFHAKNFHGKLIQNKINFASSKKFKNLSFCKSIAFEQRIHLTCG